MQISKKIILFLVLYCLLINPAFAGYSYIRSITVNCSQVNNNAGSLTKFPILVCGNSSSGSCNTSVSNMATVGNNGHVQNSSGYDIIFTTDPACTNKLSWDMYNYVASTGEFEAFVTNASTALSGTSNTTFYMCYGNPAITTLQSTASSVYDSNYKGVWHLGNGSTLSMTDSTTNGNNGAQANGVTATSGEFDGAANFPNGLGTICIDSAGTTCYGASAGSPASLIISVPFTLSIWFNYTAGGTYAANLGQLLGKNTNIEEGFFYQASTQTLAVQYNSANNTLSTSVSTGAWHYAVLASTSSGTNLYVDGSSVASSAIAGTYGTNSATLISGNLNYTYPIYGKTEEARISSTNRSAGWISTEYNNQSNPAGFYTMSSETASTTLSTIKGNSTIAGNSTIY